MDTHILHQIETDREPELTERDISWGRHGMSVGIVHDPADANYRELAYEALHVVVTLTAQLDRARLVIVAQREELRRYLAAQIRDAA
jgi:hypothetical protein